MSRLHTAPMHVHEHVYSLFFEGRDNGCVSTMGQSSHIHSTITMWNVYGSLCVTDCREYAYICTCVRISIDFTDTLMVDVQCYALQEIRGLYVLFRSNRRNSLQLLRSFVYTICSQQGHGSLQFVILSSHNVTCIHSTHIHSV